MEVLDEKTNYYAENGGEVGMNTVLDLYERKCPVCGKVFEASMEHVFRTR